MQEHETDIPGMSWFEDFIDQAQHDRLMELIDARPWDHTLARRTQHYGYRYDYRSRSVPQSLGPLPNWLTTVAGWVAPWFPDGVDQVIVNDYQPGQRISAHTDAPIFGPTVATLQLCGDGTFHMRRDGRNTFFPLVPRWLMVLEGEARSEWEHWTNPSNERRVSVTFRTVLNKGQS